MRLDAVRVPVELLRVQRVEENLPRCAQRLAPAPTGNEMPEARQPLIRRRAVEQRLPDVWPVALLEEPVELDGVLLDEWTKPLSGESIRPMTASRRQRTEVQDLPP